MWYAIFSGGGFFFFLGGFLFNLEGSGGGTQAFVFCFFILGGGDVGTQGDGPTLGSLASFGDGGTLGPLGAAGDHGARLGSLSPVTSEPYWDPFLQPVSLEAG